MDANEKKVMDDILVIIETLRNSDVSISQILKKYNCKYHFFRKAVSKHLSTMEYYDMTHRRAGRVFRAAMEKRQSKISHRRDDKKVPQAATAKKTITPEERFKRRLLKQQKIDEADKARVAEFQQQFKRIKKWMCTGCAETYSDRPGVCGKCGGSQFEQIETLKTEAA